MNALIIDDEPAAVDLLVRHLERYPAINIAATGASAAEAVALAEACRPDVIFLDIELPDLSGLEAMAMVAEKAGPECRIVIYTAYNDYVLSSFRQHAFDCLLKPVDPVDLAGIIERLAADRENRPKENPAAGKLLFYTSTEDFRLVALRDICVFRYDSDLRLWAAEVAGSQKPLYLRRNVTKDSILAIDPRFVLVSKRHIINLNYLMEVQDNVCRFYPPFDGIDGVKVGRLYRRALINRFNSL